MMFVTLPRVRKENVMEPPLPPRTVTVRELIGGDLVRSDDGDRLFAGSMPHPVWAHLVLAVWVGAGGVVSLDALPPDEVVEGLVPSTPAASAERLAQALVDARVAGRAPGWPV